jgi:hypothetical protein
VATVTDDTMTPPDEGDSDTPMSLRARVTGVIVGILLMLVIGFAFLHVALKPVSAGAPTPESHYPGPCWVCHIVASNAEATDGP